MPQLTIYELASLPPVSLAGMTAGTDYLRVITRDYLRVRVRATGDAGFFGSVRPYYRRGSAWIPLRGDGVDAVSVPPVTAQADKLNGWADGLFHSGALSTPVILVKEAGNGVGVSGLQGILELADTEG